MKCRSCNADVEITMADLGYSPPANAYVNVFKQPSIETRFPLLIKVCSKCYLVQTQDFTRSEELFNEEYAYFSSYSETWLEHSKNFAYKITEMLKLNESSFVIEIASNDGYMLKNFVNKGVRALGIEPTRSTAEEAIKAGIETEIIFFSSETAKRIAKQYELADLVISNNVLAHVPDILDFVKGYKTILKSEGVATFEFQHLLTLMKYMQFDTLYHEHFSYLSLIAIEGIFEEAGLRIFDVEELETHGGSLRIYVCHKESNRSTSRNVTQVRNKEISFGLNQEESYLEFQEKCFKIKRDTIKVLYEESEAGNLIVAYGAAAKGNTLLNYCGITKDLVAAVADANIHKQGKLMPGSQIPIVSLETLLEMEPDIVLILPWNLLEEIKEKIVPLFVPRTRFLSVIPTVNWIQ